MHKNKQYKLPQKQGELQAKNLINLIEIVDTSMSTKTSKAKISNKAEIFAVVMAIIGLIANLLTIVASGVAIAQVSESLPTKMSAVFQDTSLLDLLKALSAITLIYSWFVLSWFLTRRYFLIWANNYPKSSLSRYRSPEEEHIRHFGTRTILTVIGLGIVLLPLFILSTRDFAFAALFLPLPIWGALAILMPIIYPGDMDIHGLFTDFLGY